LKKLDNLIVIDRKTFSVFGEGKAFGWHGREEESSRWLATASQPKCEHRTPSAILTRALRLGGTSEPICGQRSIASLCHIT
jgi:hypothetical protein